VHKRHCYYSMHRPLSIQIKKKLSEFTSVKFLQTYVCFMNLNARQILSDKLRLGRSQRGSRPAISPFSHPQRCTLSRQLIVKLQQADRRRKLNNTNITDFTYMWTTAHITNTLACAEFTLHQTNTYMGWWHHVVRLQVMLRAVVAVDRKFVKDGCR
jgi:hypothetical protein